MQEKTHWNPGRWANSGSRDWTHAPAGIREVESCPHIEKGWRRPLSALQQLRIKTSPLLGRFGPSGGFGLFGYKLSQRMRSCLWQWSFRRRGWSSCRSWRRLCVGAPCNKQSLRSSHRLKVGKKDTCWEQSWKYPVSCRLIVSPAFRLKKIMKDPSERQHPVPRGLVGPVCLAKLWEAKTEGCISTKKMARPKQRHINCQSSHLVLRLQPPIKAYHMSGSSWMSCTSICSFSGPTAP